MYPAFCTIPRQTAYADPIFALASERLRGGWPGLILAVRGDVAEVLIAADGAVVQVAGAEVTPRLPDDVALDLMDAVEEAIEDAQELGDRSRAARLEATLALLERALDDGGS